MCVCVDNMTVFTADTVVGVCVDTMTVFTIDTGGVC